MSILRKEFKGKKVIICIVLAFAMILSVISVASVDNAAKASDGTIQYNNKVFTKKLFKNTKMIGFGSDGSQVIKDKKTVKKVYGLLAKMKLKAKKPDPMEEIKAGFVTVVIHTKNGKKKWFRFQGNEIENKYIITENYPIDKIRKIYNEKMGISLVVNSFNEDTGTINYSIKNMSERELPIPTFFLLEKLVDGQWIKVSRKTNEVTADAMLLMPGDTNTMEANLYAIYDLLESGKYRIVIPAKETVYSTEFEIDNTRRKNVIHNI